MQTEYHSFGTGSANYVVPEYAYGLGVGPSYGFRFRSKRIEMDPAILLTGIVGNYKELDRNFKELGSELQFPIAIYPMDFNNDCNCPTFNKEGEKFRKGFYFFVLPALRYSQIRVEKKLQKPEIKDGYFRYSVGIGIGMDFGINRHTTLSPSLSFHKTFQDSFSYFIAEDKLNNSDASRTYLQLALRLNWYKGRR